MNRTLARALARGAATALPLLVLLASKTAFAATYKVGPNKPYTSLKQLDSALSPGDIVEVDGDHTYAGGIVMQPQSSGTPNNKVIIRGIPINGKRPVLQGASQTIVFYQDHVIFENFEVTGGSMSCVINKGHDITLRNVLVRDCGGHGILGTDMYSGSQTLEFVEVRNCGDGQYDHQVYLATDNTMHPNAVVRIQHSYIHDAAGGHNVKSRAGRNEIYNNWIEGPTYHVLDLIGADGQAPGLVREDSDVVGNVLIQTGSYAIARIGGDGTGASSGRYRFAYNTIVLSPSQGDAFRLQDQLESLAIDNNVFLKPNGGSATLVKNNGAIWTTGTQRVSGRNNFVANGLVAPAFFTSTLSGSDAGLENVGAEDYRPLAGSPLVDAAWSGVGPDGYVIPNPLAVPVFSPTPNAIAPNLTPPARPSDGSPDVGAFELANGQGGGGDGGGDPGEGGAGEGGAGEGGAGQGGAAGGAGGSAEGGAPAAGGSPGEGGSGAGAEGGAPGGTGGGLGSDDGGSVEGPQCSYVAPSRRSGGWLFAVAALAGLAVRRRRS